jgi:hypothetical protein
MDRQTSCSVIQRLSRLERAYHWWKLLGSCSLALLGMLLFISATTVRTTDEIRAKRFVVIDENAQPRVILGSLRSGSDINGLSLIAADGRKRAELSLLPDDGSPALSLYDRKGRRRGCLAVDDSEAAASQLQLISINGSRIDLGVWTNADRSQPLQDLANLSISGDNAQADLGMRGSTVELDFSHKKVGKPIIDIEKGTAVLRLHEEGPTLILADQRRGETSSIVLGHTSLHHPRTGTVEERPAASVVLHDKQGKVMWSMP